MSSCCESLVLALFSNTHPHRSPALHTFRKRDTLLVRTRIYKVAVTCISLRVRIRVNGYHPSIYPLYSRFCRLKRTCYRSLRKESRSETVEQSFIGLGIWDDVFEPYCIHVRNPTPGSRSESVKIDDRQPSRQQYFQAGFVPMSYCQERCYLKSNGLVRLQFLTWSNLAKPLAEASSRLPGVLPFQPYYLFNFPVQDPKETKNKTPPPC
ncbi:hypothetical protein BDW59DRAFT_35319 [Aspergillus cavernicola]|uniref:Uncharacterized protein n=1 Tax=Aspergillus cavernicola TaxID=176166 RepID=A0ABR4HC36_9EURO